MRRHDIMERTQVSLTFLTILNINSRTNRGTSDGFETSEQMYLTDLYSPRRELANGGLGIVAALRFFWN